MNQEETDKLKKVYFLDTYALIELSLQNANYSRFNDLSQIITSRLNLMEFYYYCIRRYDEKIAITLYNNLKHIIVNWEFDSVIFEASKLKLENKKKKLSYIDSIGYILSKKLEVPFVTGDKEFENMDNVLFIK